MSSAEYKNLEVQADQSGAWQYKPSASDFDSGNYRFVTEDESGTRIEKSIVILHDKNQAPTCTATTAENDNVLVKTGFYSPYIILVGIVILLLMLNLFYLWEKTGANIRKKIRVSKRPKKKKYFSRKRIIALVLVLIALTTILFVFIDRGAKNNSNKTISIGGSVINPIDSKGVKNVDLTVGNTSIKTSDSGAYNFNQIKSADGIKITYPVLSRALVKTMDDAGQMRIYFNAEMYNTVIAAIDAESRGQYDKIYQYLYPKAKQKVSESDFMKKYEPIFSQADINSQAITIGKIELLTGWDNRKYDIVNINQATSIEVINRGKSETFYLIFESGKWWVVN